MREVKMVQQIGIQRESTRFRHPNVVLSADRTIVPCAEGKETIPVVLAMFPDHGRPAFVGSTIRSRDIFIEAASELTLGESQRLDRAWRAIMEGLLHDGFIKSDGIFKSKAEGKPEVHVVIIGEPHQDNSLRLYFHVGEHEGAPVLFQDSRVRKKGAREIEKTFEKEGRYVPPNNWDKGKATGRGGR